MPLDMFADISAKPKHSKRVKRTSVSREEMRSVFLREPHARGLSGYLPALGGLSIMGVFLSILVTSDAKYGIRTNLILWIGVTLLCIITVTLAYLAVVSVVIVLGAALEYILDGRPDRQSRRRALVENTRILKKSVVNGRIPLEHMENVLITLRTGGLSGEPAARGPIEVYLMSRWLRQRLIAVELIETSWQQALPEAMAQLTCYETQYASTPSSTISGDTTEVAWYLARHPSDIAVLRLLSEYLPVQQTTREYQTDGIGESYSKFRIGVVYTPRWVYELVHRAENFGRSSTERQFSGRHSRLLKRRATVGDECVPIGDVDREMVDKLYAPDGNGPLSSLRETVETARHL